MNLFSSPGLGTVGLFCVVLFYLFFFIFIQEGKATGWHPLQRTLTKSVGVNSFPVPANVPVGLCLYCSIKPTLQRAEPLQPTRKFVVYHLLPSKSVWVVCIPYLFLCSLDTSMGGKKITLIFQKFTSFPASWISFLAQDTWLMLELL